MSFIKKYCGSFKNCIILIVLTIVVFIFINNYYSNDTISASLHLKQSNSITSKYGFRKHPITGKWTKHNGVDISMPINTKLPSIADGVVVISKRWGGYGNMIAIRPSNKKVLIMYGHCNKLLKKTGDVVKRGDIIALSGNSGLSTGPHLHFEIRYNGKPIDPTALLVYDK